jgi:hypothetical protein
MVWRESNCARSAGKRNSLAQSGKLDELLASIHNFGRPNSLAEKFAQAYTKTSRMAFNLATWFQWASNWNLAGLVSKYFATRTRVWLDETGPPVESQQKLMRHAHVSSTIDQYGNASAMQNARPIAQSYNDC